jgi:hypothetical protein
MDQDNEVRELVKCVRTSLPNAAARADQFMLSRGFDREDLEVMTYVWLETFAEVTNDAARERDGAAIQAHTELLAKQYQSGGKAVRDAIDIAYAENLMWDLDDAARAWAWPRFSETVRRLYVEMWGEPRF